MVGRVLVVGGGICGLATALALHRVGIVASVFERAPEICEVGAGLSLWSNAVQSSALVLNQTGDDISLDSKPWLGPLNWPDVDECVQTRHFEDVVHFRGDVDYLKVAAGMLDLLVNRNQFSKDSACQIFHVAKVQTQGSLAHLFGEFV